VDATERITIDLNESERFLLRCGLVEWGGPARCTEEMSIALGFESVEDLFAQRDRLIEAIGAGEPMTRFDWLRVLLATEIVFASNLVGSGMDWSITTGLSDAESVVTLRGVQRKLTSHVRGLIGNGFGTRAKGF
jgi:hypothetical protein